MQTYDRKDGTRALFIRLSQNKKHKYITTSITINAKDFNPKAKFGQWVRSSNLRSKTYNSTLIAEIHKLEDLIQGNQNKTLDQIVDLYKNGTLDGEVMFVDFTLAYLKRNEHLYKPASRHRYDVSITDIKEYTQKQDIPITDITTNFLESLYNHCRDRGNMFSTINNKFKKIKKIMSEAVKDGIIKYDENPFLNFTFPRNEKPNRSKLTLEELDLIRGLELKENSNIWHARNIFLLQFNLAGIRVSDILTLKYENLTEDNRIQYKMHKTGEVQTFKLSKEAMLILSYYLDTSRKKTDYILHFIPNIDLTLDALQKTISKKTSLINNNLKTIAHLCEIDKKITTHIARHTFASIAAGKTKDIRVVSKLLGHSNVSTTQTYIASLNDKEMDSAIDTIYDD